jgi:hypothetical protein
LGLISQAIFFDHLAAGGFDEAPLERTPFRVEMVGEFSTDKLIVRQNNI